MCFCNPVHTCTLYCRHNVTCTCTCIYTCMYVAHVQCMSSTTTRATFDEMVRTKDHEIQVSPD